MSRITVLGLQGSGKSYLTEHGFIAQQPNHLIVDIMREYPDKYHSYEPKYLDNPDKLKEEISLIIKKLIIKNCVALEDKNTDKTEKKRLKLVVFEEADLYNPSSERVASGMRSLIVQSRHLQLDMVFVSRRPSDLSAYLMDTSDYLIIGKQVGANALKIINNLNSQASARLKKLNYDNHEFLLLDRNREISVITAEDTDILKSLLSNKA